MMRFIGKFEFKPFSYGEDENSPEQRRARNIANSLKKSERSRDFILRRIHQQNMDRAINIMEAYPNMISPPKYFDYNPEDFDLLRLLEEENINIDNEDDLDLIEYTLEKRSKNDPITINAVIPTGKYYAYDDIDDDYFEHLDYGKWLDSYDDDNHYLTSVQNKYRQDHERVASQDVHSDTSRRLSDLYYIKNKESYILPVNRDPLKTNHIQLVPYTPYNIVKDYRKGKIDLDRYDEMMDFQNTDDDDLKLYLSHLAPSIVEKIKSDYGFYEILTRTNNYNRGYSRGSLDDHRYHYNFPEKRGSWYYPSENHE